MHKDQFCYEVQVKIKTIFWLLNNYEDSVLYGKVVKIKDEKNMLEKFFESQGIEINKKYKHFDRASLNEI